MEKLMLFALMFTLVSVGNSYAEEGNPDLRDFADIIKRYDEMPYSEKPSAKSPIPEQAFGHPFCLAVALRQAQEKGEMFRESLKNNPTLQRYYDEFEVIPRLPRAGSEVTLIGNKDKSERPVFFGPDTPVIHIKVSQDGSLSDGSGRMKDVAEGDFVLSTTAYLLKDDARYHKTCWARVAKVHSKEVGAGSLFYLGEKPGKRNKVISVLNDSLTFYVKVPGAKNGARMKVTELQSAPQATEFVSPHTKEDGTCYFATIDDSSVGGSPTMLMNFDVELTGIYFIGEKGSQIPVHH